MPKGADTRHDSNRQVGRDRFAPPDPSRMRSGPVTYYNGNTEWASDPVDPSWAPPTGPAANLQQQTHRSVMERTMNGNPNAPKPVQEGAKKAGGVMQVTAGKAIPLGKHGGLLIPAHDEEGNYVAKPHEMRPGILGDTGADAWNRHVENNPAYPGGKMGFDADGNVHAGRKYY